MFKKILVRDVKIIYTVCPVTAILFTFLRLGLRARTAKLWWDDALAFMAAVFTGLTAAAGWMHWDAEKLDSRTTRIVAYYMLAQSFYGALWYARLSILYSIVRIASSPQMRTFLHWLGAAMVLAWAVLFAQIFWLCVPLPHWTSLTAPQCPLTPQVAVVQLVSDILADASLIAVPIRLFMNSQLETGTNWGGALCQAFTYTTIACLAASFLVSVSAIAKLRLMVIFSASILTTVVSLVHAYYLLKTGSPDVLVAAIVEVAVSVIVCNFSVVVTAFHRVCKRKKSTTFEDSSEDRDGSNIHTFGAWSPNGRKNPGKTTTAIDLTTINVKKESDTYVDIRGASQVNTGQVERVKGPAVMYYETHNQDKPRKAYFRHQGNIGELAAIV